MKKRILSMLMIAVMVGMMLTGCGKDVATQSEQTNEVSAKTDEVVKQPEESTEQILQEDATEVTVPMETELAKIPEETTKSENKEETTVTAPQYTYTDLSANMYAKSSVNVRDLPYTDGEKVGGLSKAQSVEVTGQCNETGWYRIKLNGAECYVSDKYIVADKPVAEAAQKPVEQPAPEQPAQQPETPTEQPVQEQPAANSFPYELMTIIQFDEHTVGYYYCGDAGLNPTSDLGSLLQQACTDLYASKYSNYSGYYRDYFKIGTYDIGEVWALKAWYTAYN